MIQGGNNTYPLATPSLLSWQPSNQALNSFLIAILATILSYQLAAIVFDLFLGVKPPGQTTASDVSILLLCEDGSIFNLLANLHLSRVVSHLKFHGFRSTTRYLRSCHTYHDQNNDINFGSSRTACYCLRKHNHCSTAVLPKLTILLAAAPFANLLALLLTADVDRTLNFKDVNFGGLAFGLNPNLSVSNVHMQVAICSEYATTLSDSDISLVAFYYCARAARTNNSPPLNGTAMLRLSHGLTREGVHAPLDAIIVEYEQRLRFPHPHGSIAFPPILIAFDLHAVLRDEEGGVWRIKVRIGDLASVERLFEKAMKSLLSLCAEEFGIEPTEEAMSYKQKSTGEAWLFEWPAPSGCAYDEEKVKTVIGEDLSKFTLVESERLEVLQNNKEEKVTDASGFAFVKRRRASLTTGLLGIFVAIAVALRIIVGKLTNNDVHLGIEMLLKDTLRLQTCDGMLQNGNRVDYSQKIYTESFDANRSSGCGSSESEESNGTKVEAMGVEASVAESWSTQSGW